MNANAIESFGLDTVSLMEFIDLFGISPEMVPDGRNFNDVVNFMKSNGFREEHGSLSNCKYFVKLHGDMYFLLRIQQHRIGGKSCAFIYEYAYEMTVRIMGTPMLFNEKDKNLRNALCNAFAKAQNWSVENGNSGNGIEQTA